MGTIVLLASAPFILAGFGIAGITKSIMNYDEKEREREATQREVAIRDEDDDFKFPTAKEAIETVFEATDEVEQGIKKAGKAGLKALGKFFKALGEE